MIRLVSDPHGGQDIDGLHFCLAQHRPGDLMIILGDLELHFRDTDANRAFSGWFESLDCDIAFIDGNHENFDYLSALPEEDWHGGRVHRLSPHIVHLMRGYVYDIDSRSFFTMGGCVSSQKWKDNGLWWPQEDPTAEEIARGYESLRLRGNRVDYILTHKHALRDPDADPMTLQGLTNFIEKNVGYRHWYSGHWHVSRCPDERHTYVFQEPILLP